MATACAFNCDEAFWGAPGKEEGCVEVGVCRSASSCSSQVRDHVLFGITVSMDASHGGAGVSAALSPAFCTSQALLRVCQALPLLMVLFVAVYDVQTMIEACTQAQRCSSSQLHRGSGALSTVNTEDSSDAFYASCVESQSPLPHQQQLLAMDCAEERDDDFPSRYQACVSMIRCAVPCNAFRLCIVTSTAVDQAEQQC